MKLAIFCVTLLAFANLANGKVLSDSVKSYENHRVLRVKIDSEEASYNLSEILGVTFWNEGRIGGYADIMVAPQDITQVTENLMKQEFDFSTMVENVGDLIRLEKVPAINRNEKPSSEHSMTWTEYHEQDDVESFLDYLANTYDFVEVESIGESYEGRPMRVVKVCKNGCGNKPAMWIDGGIHAREWISPAAVTWMMHELIDNDADHSDLTENLDWYILGIVNPDGYAYTKTHDRLWRKTRSPNDGGMCSGTDANRNWGYHWNNGGSSDYGCSDTYHGAEAFSEVENRSPTDDEMFGLECSGTDANRNWGYHWNNGGSSDHGCSETYHGTEAFSEVENRNIRDFISKHKDQIKFFNTIHSYSQLVLLPWGDTTAPAPGYDKLKNLADKSNEALYAVHGTRYDVGCIPCLLYIASGGSMDWALGEAGIPYSYGMELRDTGHYGFLLPAEQIIPTAEETWAFHQNAARMIADEFA